MERSETVIVSQSATDLEQVFELLGVTDEHGKLIARRDAADLNATRPIPIRLACNFELGGDPDRSRRILEETRRRLADLAGVDYRPVR